VVEADLPAFAKAPARLAEAPKAFACHTATRNPMQLRVDDRNETVQRLVVAIAPRFEQPRDVVEGVRNGRIFRLF
jgi:hypothetical protein